MHGKLRRALLFLLHASSVPIVREHHFLRRCIKNQILQCCHRFGNQAWGLLLASSLCGLELGDAIIELQDQLFEVDFLRRSLHRVNKLLKLLELCD